jgi:hypothetical protein
MKSATALREAYLPKHLELSMFQTRRSGVPYRVNGQEGNVIHVRFRRFVPLKVRKLRIER